MLILINQDDHNDIPTLYSKNLRKPNFLIDKFLTNGLNKKTLQGIKQ
ncbi:hypothetical protein DB42_DD00100 [Neochlamydia sp. EPS4]|nr:hypothetical protein DB42_DD00100 [Neochlamydia sp. EPS4]